MVKTILQIYVRPPCCTRVKFGSESSGALSVKIGWETKSNAVDGNIEVIAVLLWDRIPLRIVRHAALQCIANQTVLGQGGQNLNQKWSGIRIQISGLIRIRKRTSAGSLPKCSAFISSVISPSFVTVMLINLKRPILREIETWFGIRIRDRITIRKLSRFFPLVGPIVSIKSVNYRYFCSNLLTDTHTHTHTHTHDLNVRQTVTISFSCL